MCSVFFVYDLFRQLKKRQADNEAEKRKEASFVNLKASRIGQALFRDIKKT